MQSDDHEFEADPWRADYSQGWSRLALGLRRHLARIAPPDAFQQVLADGSDQVMEAFGDKELFFAWLRGDSDSG